MEKAEMPRYNYDVEAHWAGSDKKPKQIGENFLRMIAFLSKSHSAPSGCGKNFGSYPRSTANIMARL